MADSSTSSSRETTSLGKVSRTIHFIPDKPLEHFDPQHSHFDGTDAPRCEPLAEQLARQLLAFIRQPERKTQQKRLSPPRIGVLGGLGQGKTTVIRWALYKTEAALMGEASSSRKPWLPEQRVEWFDTAHYKNDDLEYELDRLLGGVRPWANGDIKATILAYALPLSLVAMLAMLVGLLIELPSFHAKLLAVLFTSVWGLLMWLSMPFGYWWRSGQRSMNLGRKSWWLQGWKLLLRKTEILIIDNLDRASLAQQRAVLRALYKHNDELGYAVVIGFDETRLLESRPDPESPLDLLRKAIHIEARMPVRVSSDTLRLAWMATTQAAKLNSSWAAIVTDSQALGALARILELLSPIQPVSPRAAKHVVNNALFTLALIKDDRNVRVDDWRAALRLLALYMAVPELCKHGDALRSALQRNDRNGLDELFKGLSVDDKDGVAEAAQALAKKIFGATRSYFPADRDWSPWVVGWVTRAFGEFNADAGNARDKDRPTAGAREVPAFDSVNFLADGMNRVMQGLPRTELANLSALLPGLAAKLGAGEPERIENVAASALLPLLDILLLRTKRSSERTSILFELWMAADEGLLQWMLPQIGKGPFYYYLAELLLLEDEPWPLSGQQRFTHWWGRVADPDLGISVSKRLRLLSLVPASRFHLAEILAYAALSEEKDGNDLGPEHWLAAYGTASVAGKAYPFPCEKRLRLIDDPIQRFMQEAEGNTEVIKRLWPFLTVDAPHFPGLLIEHCAAWRRLGLRSGVQPTPLEYLLLEDESFKLFLETRMKTGMPGTLILALAEIFGPSGTRSWSSQAWLQLLGHHSGSQEVAVIRRLHQIRKRLAPIWNKPCETDSNIELQCILAATFPGKRALNVLLERLPRPLSRQTHNLLEAHVRQWALLCARDAWKPGIQKPFHGTQSKDEYAELVAKSWLRSLPKVSNAEPEMTGI
jgi:hypothetical protein